MKSLILAIFFLGTMFCTQAQRTFCDGWNDGYAAGKQSLNDRVYTIPICPVPRMGQDSYEIGYSRGYEKATDRNVTLAPVNDENNPKGFCNGWDEGYTRAMNENGKTVFMVPVCPVARINQDDYTSGYQRGYNTALEKMGVTHAPAPVGQTNESKGFCDGWEEGYQYGLQQWAIEHDKSTPMRITPICPIPSFREDNYSAGYERGRQQAMEDME